MTKHTLFIGLARSALVWPALSAATASAQQPPAVSFAVNTTADLIDDNIADGACHTSANTCSLRAAIMQANHLTTAGLFVTINVPAGTYVLTRAPGSPNDEDAGDLNLNSPLAAGQRITHFCRAAGRLIPPTISAASTKMARIS